MNELGVPNPEGIAKAVDSASGFMDTIQKMFPGISLSSESRAEARMTKRAMKGIEIIREWGKSVGMDDESTAIICEDHYRRVTRSERLGKVISFAAESVNESVQVIPPSDDWIEAFRDHAEKATDEDMQRMWGTILAGEMESPGSVSKRTMGILADMNKADADAFNKFCGCSVIKKDVSSGNPLEYMPFISGPFKSFALASHEREALDALGLARINSKGVIIASAPTFDENGELRFELNGKDYLITKGKGSLDAIWNSDFTKYGKELASLCTIGGAPGFEEAFLQWFAESGAAITEL